MNLLPQIHARVFAAPSDPPQVIELVGGQGWNRTSDTGIFRAQWHFLHPVFSTTYARRPLARLPGMDRSGHEMTGVGHDMVTLEHVYIIRNSYLKKIL